MKKGRKVNVAEPKEDATAEDRGSDNPFAEIAENWKGALSPWLSWLGVFGSAVQSRAAPVVESAINAMMRPDKMIDNLGPFADRLRDMVGLPQFADLPDIGSKLPSIEPAAELMAVALQYLRVATPIWVEACKRFEAEVALRRDKGEPFDGASDALELWNNILDSTLMEFNRSTEFADLQKRYLRGGVRQKLETRRYFGQIAEAADYPSRAELNDVYRRLHELHREVVSLRRALDSLTSASRAREPAGASAPKPGSGPRKPRSARQ
ncbi:Poly(R)-hydroxyalkanoic acid synthase subunit (PHA_synth_III_E) [Rhizobiales bacterium GAS191]|nr:Poly(R)-hydroxyalkanoic acid synthase subunit (PHA_synth_III_E) [Rhizobiales bacterium GAS191]